MSDKELEKYINTIEPNFNSHLEKGTIEMSNEYYNLLEEKMARLINKNKELNQKYLNAVADYEQEKFNIQELKKQLEDKYSRTGTLTNEVLYEENSKLINQQKKFIDYLENNIKQYEDKLKKCPFMAGMLTFPISFWKDELSKYKEIIGDDK